jgi:hypothetical protein
MKTGCLYVFKDLEVGEASFKFFLKKLNSMQFFLEGRI